MSRLCRIAAFLAICSAVSSAAEQRLRYEGVEQIYEIAFNDNRLSVAAMRRIATLSPWVEDSPDFSIGIDSTKVNGREVIDKVFLAPALELCDNEGRSPCTQNPEIADEAFLKNAARNLQQGAEQVRLLRKEKLPAGLAPVRKYLLESLEHSLALQKARYEYLRSGNPAPLRRLLCQACACASEKELLALLATTRDPRKRFEMATFRWQNEVVQCRRKRHPTAYPVDAWRRFVNEYQITERLQGVPVD